MEKVERVKELVELLNKARMSYEQNDTEIMSNFEYDKLYDELLLLEKETGVILSNSPTQNVGYEVISKLPKEKHASAMLSLNKTKEVGVLIDLIGNQDALLSWKEDGLTIVLTYFNGKLSKAVTRGNGEIGEVVTNNARVFKNIPLEIPFKGKLVLRGEAVITYSNFENINSKITEVDDKYKNPRNLCSGSVRQLDSNITSKRNVLFIAFNLVSAEGIEINKVSDRLKWLSNLGFQTVGFKLVNKDNLKQTVEEFSNAIVNNDIPSDGLVLTYNDYDYGMNLGCTGKYPRHSMAFKWQDEIANTKLIDVEWSTSRTGLVNPVAIFEEVELEGTTVSRATLHNLSIIEELKLGIGDEIRVYKANMIIPAIYENLTKSNTLKIPDKCPNCGGDVEVHCSNDSKTLCCSNPDCGAKLINKLTHFVSRDSMNIDGISKSTIEKFIDNEWINCLSDLYELSKYKENIIKMEGFGIKSYDNMIAAIENSKNVQLSNFIRSLGIPNIGRSQSKELAKRFNNDWYEFEQAIQDVYDFTKIDGFGEILNKSIHTWYKSFVNSEDTNLANIMRFIKQTKMDVSEKSLNGLIFVITGSVNHFKNRDELKEKIESMNGKVSGSVSSKTNYLINNEIASTTGKNKTAKELGVKIITEEQFLEMIK